MERYETGPAGAKLLAALSSPPKDPESAQAASVQLLDDLEEMLAELKSVLPAWLTVIRVSRFKLRIGWANVFVRHTSRRVAVGMEVNFNRPTKPRPPKEPNLVLDSASGLWHAGGRSHAGGNSSAVEAVVDLVLPHLLAMTEDPPEEPPPLRRALPNPYRRANGPVGATRADRVGQGNPARVDTKIPNN